MEYDSKGEEYFSWWLEELRGLGYIDIYEREPSSFVLSEAVYRRVDNSADEKILRGHVYTADYKILWSDKGKGLIGNEYTSNVPKGLWQLFSFGGISYVECKPDGLNLKKAYDGNNMIRLFKDKQKVVYDKYGIYVELVFHNNLFSRTFVPKRYLLTDKGQGGRKIGYKVYSVGEFISSIEGGTYYEDRGINRIKKRRI